MNWNNKLRPFFLFEENNDGKNGDGNGNSAGKKEDKEPSGNGSDKSDDKNDNKGDKGSDNKDGKDDDKNGDKKNDKKFSQIEVNEIVKNRLDQEKKKANGEFEKLYNELTPKFEESEKKITELTDKVTRLSKATNDQIDRFIDKWPDELKALDPGKDDAEARMVWYEKVLPAAKRLGVAEEAPDAETEKGKGNGKTSTTLPYNPYKGPVKSN